MKKLILFSLICLVSKGLISQSHEKGTIQLKIGYGSSLYGTITTTTFNVVQQPISVKDTGAALTSHFPIEVNYGLGERISVGLYGRFGKYMNDSADFEKKENNFALLGVASEFYAVNKEKWNLYFNLGFHVGTLKITERVNPFFTQELKLSGTGMKAGIGTNIMLFKPVAINFNLGYDGNNLNLKEYHINGNKQDLTNLSLNLITRGIRFGIGLNILLQ